MENLEEIEGNHGAKRSAQLVIFLSYQIGPILRLIYSEPFIDTEKGLFLCLNSETYADGMKHLYAWKKGNTMCTYFIQFI